MRLRGQFRFFVRMGKADFVGCLVFKKLGGWIVIWDYGLR